MARQLIRFGVVGVSNALLAAGVFAAGRAAGVPGLVAAPLGFALGAANGYLWNGRWTFGARPHGAAGRYLAVQLSAVALTDVLLAVGLPYLAVLACVTLLSFTACRAWAFRFRENGRRRARAVDDQCAPPAPSPSGRGQPLLRHGRRFSASGAGW